MVTIAEYVTPGPVRSFRFALVVATVTVTPPAEELPPEEEALEEDEDSSCRYSREQYPSTPEEVRTLAHSPDVLSTVREVPRDKVASTG